MSKINQELNALGPHRYATCVDCGRQFPTVILNVEGHIHHREPYRCIDRKDCERHKRKKK